MPLTSKLLGVFLLATISRAFLRYPAQRSAFASSAFVKFAAVSSSATSAVLTTALPVAARPTGSCAAVQTNPSTSSQQSCSMSSGDFSSRSVDEVRNNHHLQYDESSTACSFEGAPCRPYEYEVTPVVLQLQFSTKPSATAVHRRTYGMAPLRRVQHQTLKRLLGRCQGSRREREFYCEAFPSGCPRLSSAVPNSSSSLRAVLCVYLCLVCVFQAAGRLFSCIWRRTSQQQQPGS